MRSAKPKAPPEYPRPVAPIYADELPICDDTIIYFDGDEDVQEDEQQKAAKRRRIESEATAYLRGEPPYILTAQLKGPFDNGWQNPWKRRKKTTGSNESTTRIVADKTVSKPAVQTAPLPPLSPERPASPPSNTSATVRPKRSNALPPETNQDKGLDSSLKNDIGDVCRSNTDQFNHQKNRIVEDWLKKNDSYVQLDGTQMSVSSPLAKKSPGVGKKNGEPSRIEVPMPPLLDAIVHVARSFHSTRRPHTSDSAQSNKQNLEHSQPRAIHLATGNNTPTKYIETSSLHPGGRGDTIKQLRGTTSASEPPVSGSTTNSATVELGRRSPPAVGTSAILPPSHNRLASISSQSPQEASGLVHENNGPQPEPTSTRKQPDRRGVVKPATGVVSATLPSALEKPLPIQVESIPIASKEQPSIDTPNDLPSAQVLPQQTLPSAPSNVSSNGDMVELPAVPVSPHSLGIELAVKSSAPANVGTETNGSHSGFDNHNSLSGSKNAEGKRREIPRADETGYLKSYKTVTSEMGPSNKAGLDIERSSLAKTSSNARVTSSRKKASFITSEKSPGPSQASIKSAMRVAKPTTVNQTKGNVKSARSRSFRHSGKDDMEPTSPSGLKSTPKSSRLMRAPKGILKSSLSASLEPPLEPPISSINAASSGSKQDAQRPAKLDVVENETGLLNDDGFDLDAAIDDLGSFLGTWDAEKEAAQASHRLR
ncbi:hypothetical protein A1O3_04807 [Capronia epimyces CBS 606.96]|uniref:Uncharacterized protein n=1 Tax=Capronia epimyces CBS 606.96 TaxID=1182542 RepID=W9Y3C2_9EURO|nr:uncharacterized protein A1O3_04807 [Capronia epimyces CBS 606.96]EXJ84140.1 hypothetical protein A1O3_04807 [Capronia epimyces CBS 606.96]